MGLMAKIETSASASLVRRVRVGTFPEPICSGTLCRDVLLVSKIYSL